MSCYSEFFNVQRGWQSLNTGPRFNVSSEGQVGCEFIHPAQPTDVPSSRRNSHFYTADGPTDERIDGWTDRRTDGWTDRQTDGRTDRWTGGRTNGQTDGQKDIQTDGWIDGRTKERMDRMIPIYPCL